LHFAGRPPDSPPSSLAHMRQAAADFQLRAPAVGEADRPS
jgi:hypothetical protein